MHHIVAYCRVLIMFSVSFVVGSVPEDYREYPTEGQYQSTDLPGKQPPFDHIDKIPCSRFCSHLLHLRQQRFKLLCVAVVEPISSACPVIATVTR